MYLMVTSYDRQQSSPAEIAHIQSFHDGRQGINFPAVSLSKPMLSCRHGHKRLQTPQTVFPFIAL